MQTTRVLAFASIAIGALLYLGAVSGLLFEKATPPADVGVVSTSAIFVLGGLAALALRPRTA